MAIKKIGWLSNATMKDNGVFSDSGEKLVSGRFDKKACDAFNGVEKKPKVKTKKK
jgi:hypothetical protein